MFNVVKPLVIAALMVLSSAMNAEPVTKNVRGKVLVQTLDRWQIYKTSETQTTDALCTAENTAYPGLVLTSKKMTLPLRVKDGFANYQVQINDAPPSINYKPNLADENCQCIPVRDLSALNHADLKITVKGTTQKNAAYEAAYELKNFDQVLAALKAGTCEKGNFSLSRLP